MLVHKDQLEKEFIYFSYIENGITDAGYFKVIIEIQKFFQLKNILIKLTFLLKTQIIFLMKKALCINHLIPI